MGGSHSQHPGSIQWTSIVIAIVYLQYDRRRQTEWVCDTNDALLMNSVIPDRPNALPTIMAKPSISLDVVPHDTPWKSEEIT